MVRWYAPTLPHPRLLVNNAANAAHPPESLERIPKAKLKSTDTCGLCFVPYLDDKYPLVVRLPCHEAHMFDLECVRPWLKVNSTCPFCRTDFAAKKKVVVPKFVEEEEDEFDGLYA